MDKQNGVHVLTDDGYRRAVSLDVSLGYDLGADGDYRILSAVLGERRVVLFEAVSGTDRYPPGRNMHVSLSAEEFDQLVAAVTQFRAGQESPDARRLHDDFDPFLDEADLP